MAFDEFISMHRKGSSLSGNTCPVQFRAIDELGIDCFDQDLTCIIFPLRSKLAAMHSGNTYFQCILMICQQFTLFF